MCTTKRLKANQIPPRIEQKLFQISALGRSRRVFVQIWEIMQIIQHFFFKIMILFSCPLFKVYKKVIKFSFSQQKVFWVLVFTLESGIDVGQGITVGPGKFIKKNKRRA